MTLDETKQILHRISANYIYAFSNKTLDEKKEILQNWYSGLINCDYATISSKLEKHIASSKFAPTIADLTNGKSKFDNYTSNEIASDFDLEIIKHNMNKYGKYINMSLEELKKL